MVFVLALNYRGTAGLKQRQHTAVCRAAFVRGAEALSGQELASICGRPSVLMLALHVIKRIGAKSA